MKLVGNEYIKDDEIVEKISYEPTIDDLKQQLNSTDWKIIKCYEYQLIGEELPYNILELHTERQRLRDSINNLEN